MEQEEDEREEVEPEEAGGMAKHAGEAREGEHEEDAQYDDVPLEVPLVGGRIVAMRDAAPPA